MIQLQHLTLTLDQSLRTLVEDLTVSLQDGDKAAVIGEEGNGKSTLLKAICDPSLIAGYATMQGDVRLGGHLPGYVAQEMPEELLIQPVSTLFAGFNPSDVAEAAAEVGLNPDVLTSERPIRTFSGGEKVKLQIARLLLSGADFLLLDEPTNDLDIETLEWMERFIVRFDGPILYISHDETLLVRTANLILHIEQVRKKNGPAVQRGPFRIRRLCRPPCLCTDASGADGAKGTGRFRPQNETLGRDFPSGGNGAADDCPCRSRRRTAPEKENAHGSSAETPIREKKRTDDAHAGR